MRAIQKLSHLSWENSYGWQQRWLFMEKAAYPQVQIG